MLFVENVTSPVGFAEIRTCSTNPCKNNGTCRDTSTGFVCDCQLPFQGEDCSQSKKLKIVMHTKNTRTDVNV